MTRLRRFSKPALLSAALFTLVAPIYIGAFAHAASINRPMDIPDPWIVVGHGKGGFETRPYNVDAGAPVRIAPIHVGTDARAPEPIFGDEDLPGGAKVETIAGPLSGPVAMAFTPDGRLLVTEKHGAVRMIQDGQLLPDAVLDLPTNQNAERGMLGIAVHPQFKTNGWVFVYNTVDADPPLNRIVRFTLSPSGAALDVTPVYTVSEATNIHNGGSLRFGLDGMLYVGVGEGDQPSRATDPGEPRGKVLRLDASAAPMQAAPGNPFAALSIFDPAIWALGLRNPFGLAVDPIRNGLFLTDNGPSCNDELNLVKGGTDYGWGAQYDCRRPDGIRGQEPPKWIWPETVGITGLTLYARSNIPGWYGSLLICSVNKGTLFRARLNDDHSAVTAVNRVADVHCNLDIATGPDGALYYLDGGGYSNGTVRRITADRAATPGPRPTRTPLTNSPGVAFLPRLVQPHR